MPRCGERPSSRSRRNSTTCAERDRRAGRRPPAAGLPGLCGRADQAGRGRRLPHRAPVRHRPAGLPHAAGRRVTDRHGRHRGHGGRPPGVPGRRALRPVDRGDRRRGGRRSGARSGRRDRAAPAGGGRTARRYRAGRRHVEVRRPARGPAHPRAGSVLADAWSRLTGPRRRRRHRAECLRPPRAGRDRPRADARGPGWWSSPRCPRTSGNCVADDMLAVDDGKARAAGGGVRPRPAGTAGRTFGPAHAR